MIAQPSISDDQCDQADDGATGLQKPDHTVPDQLPKEMLAGNWNISDVSAKMVKEFKEKYKMK